VIPLSPHEVRARMVASYRASYQRAGSNATEREIEQLVVADCELVDRARAAGHLTSGGKRDRAPGPVRPDLLAKAQHDTGTRITDKVTPVRIRALHSDPMQVSERWGSAVHRIGQVLERTARASSLGAAVAGAELPVLAKRYADTWSYFITADRPAPAGVDHNPFRSLAPKDRARAFMRAVEDICDASTGALGPWWVR
jgi:hypothetical protein